MQSQALKACSFPSKYLFHKFPPLLYPLLHLPNNARCLAFTCTLKRYISTRSRSGGIPPKNITQAPEGDVVIKQDGTLAVSIDFKGIDDFDDKFDLRKVKDPKRLLALLRQGSYNYPLSDLIYFLRRLVQFKEEKYPNFDINNMTEFNIFVKKIKEKFKEDAEGYPLIGSYAWCFWKLGYNVDKELWTILGDYILEDKYYPNLKEATFGVEGFTMLRNFVGQDYIDSVYEKLERTCILTLWEVNMTYYKRIAESLVKVNRFTPAVFNKLETHILSNLSMEYELTTMIDILFAFAMSGNGSKEFYNSLQLVLAKGHMFNRLAPYHMIWSEIPRHGAFVAKLINTYSLVKKHMEEMPFEPDFLALVYKLTTNDRIKYSLEDLVTVMEHIETYEFEDIKEVNKLLDSRLFGIEENMHAEDMIRYIDTKVRRDYGGDYSQLPQKIVTFFDNYMLKNMKDQGPGRVYYYLAESEVRGLLQGKEELIYNIIKDVGKKVQEYDFEKICYFYWFATKYGYMIEGRMQEVKPALDMCKDYIRLYRVMGKDKMQIGSNYYKMLAILNEDDLSKKVEAIEGK